RAGEVDRHATVAHLDGHLDPHRPVEGDAVVVEVARRAIRAGRNRSQGGARPALRLLHIYGGGLEHRLAAVSGQDFLERRLAGPAHRHHGLDVLQRAALRADVCPDDAHHFLVQLAAAQQAHRLEAQTLLAELARADLHAARHRAADVAPMRLDRYEAG